MLAILFPQALGAVLLSLFIRPTAGALVLSLPDVPFPASFPAFSNVTISWSRDPQDPDHFFLQTFPASQILLPSQVFTNGTLSGTVNVVFGDVGGFVLQALNDTGSLLAQTSSLTIADNPNPVFTATQAPSPTSTSVILVTSTQTVSASPSPVSNHDATSNVDTKAVAVGCVLGIAVLILIVIVLLLWRKTRLKRNALTAPIDQDMTTNPGHKSLTSVLFGHFRHVKAGSTTSSCRTQESTLPQWYTPAQDLADQPRYPTPVDIHYLNVTPPATSKPPSLLIRTHSLSTRYNVDNEDPLTAITEVSSRRQTGDGLPPSRASLIAAVERDKPVPPLPDV